jgi:hypothetical protein
MANEVIEVTRNFVAGTRNEMDAINEENIEYKNK